MASIFGGAAPRMVTAQQLGPTPIHTQFLGPSSHPISCPPGYGLYYRIGQHTIIGPLHGNEVVPAGGHYVCQPLGNRYGMSGLPEGQGLGAVGPLGNAGSIAAGTYKVTGTDVAFRNPLSPGLPNDSSVLGRLTIGDNVTVDGSVAGGSSGGGAFTNFAYGDSKFGKGYVAIQYLAPAATFNPASYQPSGGGGAIVPASSTKTTTIVETETSWTDNIWWYAGIAAVGVVGYALFFTKPGKITRRYARAKHHAYKHRKKR